MQCRNETAGEMLGIPPASPVVRKITMSQVQELISITCHELESMLIDKNTAYGNAALDPVRIFSKAGPREQIWVRIDDKLSRLARGQAAGEDVVWDLLGYLVLDRVAKRLEDGK